MDRKRLVEMRGCFFVDICLQGRLLTFSGANLMKNLDSFFLSQIRSYGYTPEVYHGGITPEK